MDPCALEPAIVEVEILLYPRPLTSIPSTGTERIRSAAEGDTDIGDDISSMMRREVRVDGVR